VNSQQYNNITIISHVSLIQLVLICISLFIHFTLLCTPVQAAYNLEVPVDPWDEYRMQFKVYSKHLLASYDRAFMDDYEGAIREVSKAVELIPEEGIGFAERGKYYRFLNEAGKADTDFKKALALFDQAIERYRPAGNAKSKKNNARKVNPAEAARLIATLRYQRGEAYFSFEQYRQASEDFAAACQGGNTIACSRIWDIKASEKRGAHWTPLTSRQFYDRQRVERPARDLIRTWVRREDSQPVRAESGPDNYIQQHYELKCSTREFRLIEAFVFSGGNQTASEKQDDSGFVKALPSTAISKLITTLCSNPRLK
jgi:tetratricopeptide (TPR) repeat protein